MAASWNGFLTWYGWEALVAIGTIGLALSTGGLAWLTRRLAREAGNETRANWRPVLAIQPYNSMVGSSPAVSWRDGALSIGVKNIGRGPALAIRGFIQAEPAALGSYRGNASMDVAAPDDSLSVVWAEFHRPRNGLHSGELFYRDVSGAEYQTVFAIEFGESSARLARYQVTADARRPPCRRERALRLYDRARWHGTRFARRRQ